MFLIEGEIFKMPEKYDFSGWATRNDVKCSDGRTIRRDAFKGNDGQKVPLVWQHQHNSPDNILGYALLQNRPQGVYAYGYFNESDMGLTAKEAVMHGDVTHLSIYANQLKQNGGDVIHGAIREVSLVLSGANPGAVIDDISHGEEDGEWIFIDNPVLAHSGETVEDEGIIYNSTEIELFHEDKEEKEEEKKEEKEEMPDSNEKTVKDVFDTLTEEQKKVVYFMIGQALEKNGADDEAEHSDIDGGNDDMKHNVFDGEAGNENVLSHSDMMTIIEDGKRFGSLKESFLAHAEDYGIENIEWLFPDAKSLNNPPEFIKRNDEWVDKLMKRTHHTPFSRIKSMFADITEADARAKGYIKGNMKKEEVFGLLKRTTTPTTVYKKQKLDRDDVIDITDFDVVAWIKTEMRMMLDEEIARAVLVGDGRSADSDDKISELNIRPIWTDADLYTIKQVVTVANGATDSQKAKAFIKAAVKSRKNYKGSGSPILFTTEDTLTDMLLIEDGMGRIIYDSMDKLKNALRVSDIVTVPIMENLTRVDGATTKTLAGIIVNPVDYNIGADKGGAINMFDDFDIDYNQQKYLIETRCSGALIKPYSAIVLEYSDAVTLTVEPDPNGGNYQSGIIVNDTFIEGTLKFATNTDYSEDTALQTGNYLALSVTATEGATVTVESNGETFTPDENGVVVIRVANRNQKVKVTAVKDDLEETKTYSLRMLKLLNA